MELRAVVDKVLTPVSGTGRNGEWKKQSVIVSFASGKYTNILELTNMRNADEFGKLIPGMEYIFHFDVTSRLYNERYFTSCNCYKWEAVQIHTQASQEYAPAQSASAPAYNPNQGGYNVPQQQQATVGAEDDLPF